MKDWEDIDYKPGIDDFPQGINIGTDAIVSYDTNVVLNDQTVLVNVQHTNTNVFGKPDDSDTQTPPYDHVRNVVETIFEREHVSDIILSPSPSCKSTPFTRIDPRLSEHNPVKNTPLDVSYDRIFVCTDGGYRRHESRGATGWIVYDSQWSVIDAGGSLFSSTTNNDMEFWAALQGLSVACSNRSNTQIVHVTDSTLVEGGLSGTMILGRDTHKKIAKKISRLQATRGNQILSFQVPRAFNSSSDALLQYLYGLPKRCHPCRHLLLPVGTLYSFDENPI